MKMALTCVGVYGAVPREPLATPEWQATFPGALKGPRVFPLLFNGGSETSYKDVTETFHRPLDRRQSNHWQWKGNFN